MPPSKPGKLAVPAAFQDSKPKSGGSGAKPKPAPAASASKAVAVPSTFLGSTPKPVPAAAAPVSAFKSSPKPAAAAAAAAAITAAPKPAPATSSKKKYCFGLLALWPCLAVGVLAVVAVAAIVVGAILGASTVGNSAEVHSVLFAQTHVFPPEGLSWYGGSVKLTLVGKREALMMFKFGGKADPAQYKYVLGFDAAGKFVGAVPIATPAELPPTEANQTAEFPFSREHYSATLPASWIVPGFGVAMSATSDAPPDPSSNAAAAAAFSTFAGRMNFSEVSADSEIDIITLPTYLYGATETNSVSLNQALNVPLKHQQEMWAKMPISKLNFKPHPLGKLQFDFLIAGPRNGQIAKRITDRSQEGDGFESMSVVLGLLGAVRGCNGHHNSQYYSAMQTLSNGRPVGPGGGLGGGSRSTGDASWTGIYIHEVGHGMGLPHAGGAYPGSYPYVGGSLKGSNWGYDTNRKVFLPNFVPPDSGAFRNCMNHRQHTPDGKRCVKQDYMQGGSGDQARGDIFTMNSDYNAAKIQQYADGQSYPDSSFPSGWARWNRTGRSRVQRTAAIEQSGLYSLTGGLPIVMNVPVYTVILPYSRTTPAARAFYPLNTPYTGNLMRYLDPTKASDMNEINGRAIWFCRGSGCDFTFRMTYQDGTVMYQLVHGGFRTWFGSALNSGANDPYSGGSFIVFAMNFPGTKKARKVELLDTPLGKSTTGDFSTATVLMTHDYP